MELTFSAFKGVIPRLSPELLPDGHASSALDAKLFNGEISAFKVPYSVWTFTKPGTILSFYLYESSYFLHWTSDVDVVPGLIADDTTARIYYTGDGAPKVTDNSLALSGGGTNYPIAYYTLGVPKPANTPTATRLSNTKTISAITKANPAVVTTSTAHGFSTGDKVKLDVTGMTELDEKVYKITVIDTTHFSLDGVDSTGYGTFSSGTCTQYYDEADKVSTAYVYTYVTGWGEEGVPSDPSPVIDRGPDEWIQVGNMATGALAGYNITNKRIYRVQTGSAGSDYQFVAEVAAAAVFITDSVDDADLGEVLQTADYDVPPADMKGLTQLANGVMAGFSKKTFCPSEPFISYAYPIKYRQTTNYEIVAIAAIGESTLLATKGKPVFVSGASPESYFMREMEFLQACVSKRSMVSFGIYAIYASPDGLVMVDAAGGARLITEQLFTRDQWQEIVPSTISAYRWDNRYIGFYDDGVTPAGFIFDPSNPLSSWMWISTYALAGHNDISNDTLFLNIGGVASWWELDSQSSLTVYKWKSAPRYFSAPKAFAWAKVYAETYPVTVNMFLDGALNGPYTVNNDGAFRIGGPNVKAKKWEIEVVTASNVKMIKMADTIREIN